MSILPIFSASFAGFVLFGLFMWNMNVLLFVLLCVLVTIFLYTVEMNVFNFSHVSGFWLFLLSEVIIFGTLLFCCLYYDIGYYGNLSSPLELPFLGCFILLGSSIVATSYHHLIWWEWSWINLILTIILGSSFVLLQIFEFEEIMVSLYDTTFHASCFCTVGLHFSHVLLGVIGLITALIVGFDIFGYYRSSVIVWYWHFVDYVWLFVYTFVYVC
uniref:Cytochrome c oxidase subunit 3 n=1 Tax=Hymenolepis microstoma TaxID=85433 RepID=A0A1E1GI09_HYMMI|nr:cytochrome c oxidase subunit III [Hymenolepis microstoma]BBB87185.1 cytochrome c oxidase subunit 3 [Hymenolepis microstoma]